jgi:Flp pilus assembly protein TadD
MRWRLHTGASALVAMWILVAGPAAAFQEGAEVTGGELPPEGIQESYRRILAAWASGEVERSPDELIELESAAVRGGDPARVRKRLLKAQEVVIHEVASGDLEVLVPIALLHHEAYRRHLAKGAGGAAPVAMGHARSMVRDLAVLYHQQSGSEGATTVASRLLTSLGGMLQEQAQQLPAADMFQQAVQLEGRNTVALLGLATIYEKNHQPESAVKVLRQLLAFEPGHSEARLRLAMGLKRLDRGAEAREILEAMAGAGEPSWLGPLVFQELGRLWVEAGDLPAAEGVLRQGRERFPENTALAVQLAWAVDRQGDQRAARKILDQAMAEPSPEASPRFLYNTVRPETFVPVRAFLEENGQSRRPLLARALAGAAVADPFPPQPSGVSVTPMEPGR